MLGHAYNPLLVPAVMKFMYCTCAVQAEMGRLAVV